MAAAIPLAAAVPVGGCFYSIVSMGGTPNTFCISDGASSVRSAVSTPVIDVVVLPPSAIAGAVSIPASGEVLLPSAIAGAISGLVPITTMPTLVAETAMQNTSATPLVMHNAATTPLNPRVSAFRAIKQGI